MVCAAGCEVTHVWGEEHAGYVGCVGREGADGDQGGDVAVLLQLPDVDVALWGFQWLDVAGWKKTVGDWDQNSLNCCRRRVTSRRWRP